MAATDQLSAVVIGGGVAGLLAARALANHVDSVTLLDKDDLHTSVASETLLESGARRRGNSQHIQPHMLLTGGKMAMDELMPGFSEELVAAGGKALDVGGDVYNYDFGAAYVRGPTVLKAIGTTRRSLEERLRGRLLADCAGRVTIRDGARVAGLLWDETRSSVHGVELAGGEALEADVVVDASGRFSPMPRWLEAAGWQAPPVKFVDAKCVYGSRHVAHPTGPVGGGVNGYACFSRPWGKRNGLILPGEKDGTWQVTLSGYEGEVPPSDDAGYLDYAASLPDPGAYNFLRDATPLTPVLRYASGTRNEQHCYQDMEMPPGLLVVGDAMQAVNPAYGQGMSAASQGAAALNRELGRAVAGAGAGASVAARRDALRQLSATWHKTLAQSNEPVWMMATSVDLRYPTVKLQGVSRPPALISGYMDTLVRMCHSDLAALETFWSVAHLVRPASVLFAPRLVLKVMWHLIKEQVGLTEVPKPPSAAPAAAQGPAAGKAGTENGGGVSLLSTPATL